MGVSYSALILAACQICGESNALVFREAAAAGVARATFVSVADYKLPGKLPMADSRRLAYFVDTTSRWHNLTSKNNRKDHLITPVKILS